jgi:hypothetical protein
MLNRKYTRTELLALRPVQTRKPLNIAPVVNHITGLANINQVDSERFTDAIFNATRAGRVHEVRRLIFQGANPATSFSHEHLGGEFEAQQPVLYRISLLHAVSTFDSSDTNAGVQTQVLRALLDPALG